MRRTIKCSGVGRWVSADCKDLNLSAFVTTPYPQYALSNAAWGQFQKAQVEQSIDMGADGFYFDGAAVNVMATPSGEATLDGFTVIAFRSYLAAKYTAQELQLQFSIADIATFDYADWVRRPGTQQPVAITAEWVCG